MEKFFSTNRRQVSLLVLVLIFCGLVSFGYRFFRVGGNSMQDNYINGEKVLVKKTSYLFSGPERGDVIVFWDWGGMDFLIKRVVGLPYDVVEIIDGYIYLNGEKYNDKLSHLKVHEHLGTTSFEIGGGEYWVIGDNRRDSWFGLVYEEQIVGKVD